MRFEEVSADTFIIYFSNKIDINISKQIKSCFNLLKAYEEIIDLTISYTSILITYNILKTTSFELTEKIIKDFENLDCDDNKLTLIEIPVLYSEEVGLDLEKLSFEKGLSIDEIVSLHTSKVYDVYSIGFLPAFAYLGELDKRLYTNRLETPRTNVSKGSVAIANLQTAIYPQNSPGGWNIIGKTPLNIFNKELENFSLIDINSQIKFIPISKDEFLSLGGVL